MEAPSIFSSVRYVFAGVRSSQPCSDSLSKTLSRLSMRSRWSTLRNGLDSGGAGATSSVGLVPVIASGCSSSSCLSWRSRASKSSSVIVGSP